MVIDKTYALQGVDVVALRQGRGYIGTAFHPKVLWAPPNEIEQQNTGFLPFQTYQDVKQSVGSMSRHDSEIEPASAGMPEINLEEDGDGPGPVEVGPEPEPEDVEVGGERQPRGPWDATTLDYAHEICEFLLFNPVIKTKPRLSVASVPTSYQSTGKEMLYMVGQTMLHAGFCVKCIVFDNASTHSLVKCMLLGLDHGLSEEEMQQMPFWRDLQYIDFPGCSIPRWPFRKPTVNNEVLFPARTCSRFFSVGMPPELEHYIMVTMIWS